ncbi:MAG TPA: N(4)-(beta-N-acetylglucosaminyl)-L-asparaginase [Vicinamibacterales bacterium]|jgi:N4-(beta-N-acetylglucosaminyl)-L-asparaginase
MTVEKIGRPALAAGAPPAPKGQAPAVITPRSLEPAVVSSANGNKYKNGGDLTCVEKAFALMTSGSDVLDALIAGVNIVELDPDEHAVGYGGLPNADGVVQLDASCMHGPTNRAGGVAGLEGVRTPSCVARKVMSETDHHLLVGEGARQFARRAGFTIEADLNSPQSRRLWLEWKRRSELDRYSDPRAREEAGFRAGLSMVADGLIESDHFYGTINCTGINAKGEIAGVTTTSGLAWKLPGRVGDSPILGAGLYVDGEVGAAGSTGRGESNLFGLCSFLIVENLRRGLSPTDAGIDALKRITAKTTDKRLLDAKGNPNFQTNFYILNAKGQHAGVSMYRSSYAICTEKGAQTLATASLFPDGPQLS